MARWLQLVRCVSPSNSAAVRYEHSNVLAGLGARRKQLPSGLLYADAGAELFARISTLEGYYPTRAELALLDDYLPQIAHHVGPGARVIEPGCPAGNDVRRTCKLLRGLDAPSGYVAVDVHHDALRRLAGALRGELPHIAIQPVTADYTESFELPPPEHAFKRSLVFMPGMTIGGFEPAEARAALTRLAHVAGSDRMLLLGADGTRDPEVLLRAYEDDRGATAAFAKNALVQLNRTHGASFDPDAFYHRAVWNPEASRVELHLVSNRRQVVRVAGSTIALSIDEPIVTEHCYKHTPAAMHGLLTTAGWRPRQVFTSAVTPFRLWLCEPIRADRV
jgi:L-histidine N-alpha-methyltransferase